MPPSCHKGIQWSLRKTPSTLDFSIRYRQAVWFMLWKMSPHNHNIGGWIGTSQYECSNGEKNSCLESHISCSSCPASKQEMGMKQEQTEKGNGGTSPFHHMELKYLHHNAQYKLLFGKGTVSCFVRKKTVSVVSKAQLLKCIIKFAHTKILNLMFLLLLHPPTQKFY